MKISLNWLKEYIDIKQDLNAVVSMLTTSGSEVKGIEERGGDHILEIEITPNRSDCLSYLGIGRELQALTARKLCVPETAIGSGREMGDRPGFKVTLEAKDLCPRYTARLITGVKVDESPAWLKEKILAMGLRPVNNVVDITNYVLFEFGQPLHAFDFDKIKDRHIIVRRAKKGEKMISIDGLTRELEEEMLVIADTSKPIAVAGVMGGLDTEVSDTTANILLESAYFDEVSVRRTSFKLALISESSYRFERGVDPAAVVKASDRAVSLLTEICGGRPAGMADKGEKRTGQKTIKMRPQRVNEILNTSLKPSRIKEILSALGLEVESARGGAMEGVLEVGIPSRRPDLNHEIDLIEEVARINGYDNIPLTLPALVYDPEKPSVIRRAAETAKNVLTATGLSEIITYALIKKTEAAVVSEDKDSFIYISNPLSAEQEMMRPSLVPGALKAASHNFNRGARDLKLFELGNVYNRKASGPEKEKRHLALALTGARSSGWQHGRREATFYDLKGILALLFRRFGLGDFRLREKSHKFLEEGASCDILHRGRPLGMMGNVKTGILEKLDISQRLFVAEIDFDTLMPEMVLDRIYSELPKYPPAMRDISLIAGDEITFESIDSAIRKKGGKLAKNIELADRYTGRQIPAGRHGLLIRVEYRSDERTLSSDEVETLHNSVRSFLADTLGVSLR